MQSFVATSFEAQIALVAITGGHHRPSDLARPKEVADRGSGMVGVIDPWSVATFWP